MCEVILGEEKWSGQLGQSAKLAFCGQETDHEEAEVNGGVQAQGGFGGESGRFLCCQDKRGLVTRLTLHFKTDDKGSVL